MVRVKKVRVAMGSLVSLVLVSIALADVPRQISYQGKLRDSSGVPVDATVSLRFRLYDNAGGTGTPLFDETHSTVNVSHGLFNVMIGAQSPSGVPDSALDATDVYLGIAINGGTELTPLVKIGATPHAIKSRSAEQLVKPSSFDPAATVDGTGSLDMPTDGATVRVPRKAATGDPAGLDGMIYYNTEDGKFRVHEDGQWGDMRGGGQQTCMPCGGWTLVGARSSYVGTYPNGYVGTPIDISDPSKEYMIAYAGSNSSGGEHYFSSSPEAVVMKFKDSNSGAVLARETNNAWYAFSSDKTLFIEQGATWSSAASSTIIYNVDIYASYLKMRIFGDGTVRYWDDGTESRCTVNGICNWGVVLVFSR